MSYNEERMRATKRDLNHRTAEILDSVSADEPVIITERGIEKWSISLVEPTLRTINGLQVSKPATNRNALQTINPVRRDQSTEDTLSDLRDDSR